MKFFIILVVGILVTAGCDFSGVNYIGATCFGTAVTLFGWFLDSIIKGRNQ